MTRDSTRHQAHTHPAGSQISSALDGLPQREPSASVGRKGVARGLTVALIGPDGAGKTTVSRRLPARLEAPSAYVYMGVAHTSASHLLPTTRIVAALRRRSGRRVASAHAAVPTPSSPAERRSSVARRALGAAASAAKFLNLVLEEWYRQAVVWVHRRRGRIVILDRHFLVDFYISDIIDPDRSLRRRAHGWVLNRLYPRPELVIYLDAPPELLLARKGRGRWSRSNACVRGTFEPPTSCLASRSWMPPVRSTMSWRPWQC